MSHLNEHGQPIRPFPVNLMQGHGKLLDQLIGVCRGILIDGVVTDGEAVGFKAWLESYAELIGNADFPLDVALDRVRRAFADGRIDEAERAELKQLMEDIAGLDRDATPHEPRSAQHARSGPCVLPFDAPSPAVDFAGKQFVVTGEFAYGVRSLVEGEIEKRGGTCKPSPGKSTDFVIVGYLASKNWVHSNYGRKIEKAMELRQELGRLRIVAESTWVEALK